MLGLSRLCLQFYCSSYYYYFYWVYFSFFSFIRQHSSNIQHYTATNTDVDVTNVFPSTKDKRWWQTEASCAGQQVTILVHEYQWSNDRIHDIHSWSIGCIHDRFLDIGIFRPLIGLLIFVFRATAKFSRCYTF